MNELVVLLAKYLIFVIAALALLLWLRLPRDKKARAALVATLATAVATALVQLAAASYDDPRPFVTSHVRPLFAHAADNGFPSDHTVAASLAAFVVLLYRRLWGLALTAMAVLVGAARVLAHVHHAVDVVAGIAIAAAAVAFGAAGANLLLHSWLQARAGGRDSPE